MNKRIKTRHGKKRTNILKRTASKTMKNLRIINSKIMKQIKKLNLLKKTKTRKYRGGG